MTSGFVFNEDGSMSYIVDVSVYDIEDDEACFRFSCRYHGIYNKILADTFEIMRADGEYTEGCNTIVTFKENGQDEFRVYKLIDVK